MTIYNWEGRRMEPTAHAKFHKSYIKRQRPEGCMRVGEVAIALYLDRAKVARMCDAGELEFVMAPPAGGVWRSTKPIKWVRIASVNHYIQLHREEVAARALKKGILHGTKSG